MPLMTDLWKQIDERLGALRRLPADLDVTRRALGKVLINQHRHSGPETPFADIEFRVYSQWGDDGIIQFLLRHVDIPPACRTFVEFGVEDYSEANTRFLLVNDNWRGLVMDGSETNIARVRQDNVSWRHELTAVSAFVDRDNIDDLLRRHGFTGELGLLHIDIDGNDYWVWERVSAVNPIIAIMEYNSVFGPHHAVTVPYDPKFIRSRAHHSYLYYGASLGAFARLAESKGYALVGCNTAGNNAYFVRSDKLGALPARSVEQAFVESRFRESRDASGRLSFVSGAARREIIQDMPVVDVGTGNTLRLRDLPAR